MDESLYQEIIQFLDYTIDDYNKLDAVSDEYFDTVRYTAKAAEAERIKQFIVSRRKVHDRIKANKTNETKY